jgi:hypothetical protein
MMAVYPAVAGCGAIEAKGMSLFKDLLDTSTEVSPLLESKPKRLWKNNENEEYSAVSSSSSSSSSSRSNM